MRSIFDFSAQNAEIDGRQWPASHARVSGRERGEGHDDFQVTCLSDAK